MKKPPIRKQRSLEFNTYTRTIFQSNGSLYLCLPKQYVKNNAIRAGDMADIEEPIDSMDGELLIRRVYPKENTTDE